MTPLQESLSRSRLSVAAALVSVVLAGLFVFVQPWGIPHRLGLALGAAFIASALLVRVRKLAPGRAALIALAGALGVLGVDALLGLGAPPGRVPGRDDGPDSSEAHPRLGRVPTPDLTFKTYYPDDRGGYLHGEDARLGIWALHVMPGSVAELVLPSGDPELLRVAIRKANRDTTWHVQLVQSRFATRSGESYFITFRARADRPRTASIGFTENHPPWRTQGLYLDVDLTPDWKAFREVFTSRRTDTNSMIAFNLAGSDIPVEVAEVVLHGPPAGRKVEPISARPRFYILHRRNELGCRDQDYPVPRPKNGVRVLALGDGFTMGIGVHEEDTFAHLIERDLNAPASPQSRVSGYEVINCGVSGYGTREHRLFYELFGAAYQPDLVLVTMGWNDDRRYWEEGLREAIQRGPGRLARLSSVVGKIDASRRLKRTHDYRRSVEDLLALDKAVRARGARLAVAVSRHGPPALGNSLFETVRDGLKGSGIPVLDLGALPAADSASGRLDPPGPGAHQRAATELLRWLRKDILPSLEHPGSGL